MEPLLDFIRFLSAARLTVGDVVARIGPIARDPGGLAPLELRPQMSGVQTARVARFPDSDVPYFLDLELTPNERPITGTIKGDLGEFRQLPTDRGHPAEIIFYPLMVGTHWQIAVIAQLGAVEDTLENAPVTRITFRRDCVLTPTRDSSTTQDVPNGND